MMCLVAMTMLESMAVREALKASGLEFTDLYSRLEASMDNAIELEHTKETGEGHDTD